MRRLVLVVVVAAACRAPTPTPTPTPTPSATPTPPPIATPPPLADAAPPDGAHHDVGHLAAGPTDQLWPTRVCLEGQTLVFEHFCGCNDALLCTIDRTGPTTLAVGLRKDPSRMPMCDDCFAMIPARCALPTPPAAWTVAINGHPAFALPLAPADGSCWTGR